MKVRKTNLKVSFLNCDLKNTDFSQASFKKIDLRGSDINGTKIDINNFKEITINPYQVIYFTNLLGLNIIN